MNATDLPDDTTAPAGDLREQLRIAVHDKTCSHVSRDGNACADCRTDAALAAVTPALARLRARLSEETTVTATAVRDAERAEGQRQEMYERLVANEAKLAGLQAFADRCRAKDWAYSAEQAKRREQAEAEVERLRVALGSRIAEKRLLGVQATRLRAERDALIDEVRTLQGDLEEFGEAQKAWVQFRRERDALKAAVKEALEIYRTHAPRTHPDRLHDPDCDVCRMGLPLSRDLPGVPDDLDQIRAWSPVQEARNPADSPSGELPGSLPPASAGDEIELTLTQDAPTETPGDHASGADSWLCPRCGSDRWVAASLTGPVEYGGRAIKQCVSCGHYSSDPVKPETTPDAPKGGED
jgi:regulator of replication initiation timing